MLGFSVYLNRTLTAADYDYLLMMRNAGFTTVFTSLHIPENDPNLVLQYLAQLTKWCKELDLAVVADVSEAGLNNLGVAIENSEQVASLGLTGLRIDAGVDYQTVVKLSRMMPIALNASTITEENINALKTFNADFANLQAWHNYYPRPETGLDAAWLKDKNAWLHHFGLQTMAFIAGDAEKRGPIYAGLPTLEKHRYFNPLAAMLELKAWGCDHVFVGDGALTSKAAANFTDYLEKGALTLHLENDLPKLSANTWHNRPDVARDVVRLEEGRARQLFSTMPQEDPQPRPRGTVTCDNKKYLRYQGELQIAKYALPPDEKVNVIGHVVKKDLPLLDFIDAGTEVIFK
ncbi:MupG family TIM beta-alpha barrel fold protein [Lactobacillus sp. ESL0791]|uniref:DUF871 domain-containing protein n=1 Tax=Lactobacillus sp. ESL0791 TaxID=2983234 RepID=UPI0023F749E2|nr:MupG family TIM beta-alpha barrel fold protein [Lactobacillus sp. ESL0791]MDF7638326.1 MupG family TIM beta-alpha barrel fold protein [Lactobacillus sp. ESL0791]